MSDIPLIHASFLWMILAVVAVLLIVPSLGMLLGEVIGKIADWLIGD